MTKKGRIQKKSYSDPKITKVNLESEEAVLTACKVDAKYTPVGSNPTGCRYHGADCLIVGS